MDKNRMSVFQMLDDFSRKKPDFVFLEDETERYTASEFFNTSIHTANMLCRMGVAKGDVVSILCKRDLETLVYFFACQMMGAIAFMVDSHQDPDKLAEENGFKIRYHIGEVRGITKVKFTPVIRFNAWSDPSMTTIALSTSGSTGERKIVKQSQYAFMANAVDSKDFGEYLESDVALAFLPLNHVFAIALLFTAICYRFKVVVADSADTTNLLNFIEKYHVTRFNAIPQIFLNMVRLRGGHDISSLKCAYIGGAPSSPKDYYRIEAGLGIKLIPVYGMSECVGISSGKYQEESETLCSSVGSVYPSNSVKISEDGEVLVKGPSMCNGYYKGDLDLTDGYLPTGDLGEMDEKGYLHITGRKKEIIIRNGVNISIAEITKKIEASGLFSDFCIVGIGDDTTGEIPALAAVLKRPSEITYVRGQLGKYLNKAEMPGKIAYVEGIPLLENGKVDKVTIRKMFL